MTIEHKSNFLLNIQRWRYEAGGVLGLAPDEVTEEQITSELRRFANFTENLHRIRTEKGMSVKELAQRAGVDVAKLQAWDDLGNPDIYDLTRKEMQ